MNVRTVLLASTIVALASAPALAGTIYNTDPGHTEVRFGWNHAGVSMQHGEFTGIEGTLDFDPENVEASTLSVVIDPASISTGVEALDGHVASADFFDVATFPEITFESTSIERTGDETADVTGNLTIRGITNPIVLHTTVTHQGEHPLGAFMEYNQGEWLAFTATTEFDADAFGLGQVIPVGTVAVEIVTEMKAAE